MLLERLPARRIIGDFYSVKVAKAQEEVEKLLKEEQYLRAENGRLEDKAESWSLVLRSYWNVRMSWRRKKKRHKRLWRRLYLLPKGFRCGEL